MMNLNPLVTLFVKIIDHCIFYFFYFFLHHDFLCIYQKKIYVGVYLWLQWKYILSKQFIDKKIILIFLFLFANFPVMMCICKAHDHHGKRVQLSQYVNIDNTVTSKTPFEFSIFRLSLIIIYIVFLVVSASPHLSRSWNLRPSQVSVIFYFVIWF